MHEITAEELMEIVAARHDGGGWALDRSAPEIVADQLHRRGMVRRWKDRWQLTPQGFRLHPEFERE